MFELRMIRKAIKKYNNVFTNCPEIIRAEPDVYLEDINKLVELTRYYLDFKKDDLDFLIELKDMGIFKLYPFKLFFKPMFNYYIKSLKEVHQTLSDLENIQLRVTQVKLFTSPDKP